MPREWYVELKWKCANGHENPGRLKVCDTCGAPKTDVDDDIDDGSLTPVADSSLVAQASAGPDWKCRYCGSVERRDDGECARCGVPQAQGEARPSSFSSAEAPTRPEGWRRNSSMAPPMVSSAFPRRRGLPWWLIAACIGMLGIIAGYFIFKPLDLHGTVTAVSWQRTIHIDKYALRHDSGFVLPTGAQNVINDGQKYHYTNHNVLVGHQRVTSAALCGTRNCRQVHPHACVTPKPVCTKQKNGFKRCTQRDTVCQYDTVCDPKTCDAPIYQDQDVYDTFYEWDEWGWAHERDVTANGSTLNVSWPDTTPPALQPGEQEREAGRDESYTVRFMGRKGDSWNYTPKSADEFLRYPLGSRHKIRVSLGSVSQVFD